MKAKPEPKRKPGRPRGSTKPSAITERIAIRLPVDLLDKLKRQPGTTLSKKLRCVLEALP